MAKRLLVGTRTQLAIDELLLTKKPLDYNSVKS
jgi:hypothetical protein